MNIAPANVKSPKLPRLSQMARIRQRQAKTTLHTKKLMACPNCPDLNQQMPAITRQRATIVRSDGTANRLGITFLLFNFLCSNEGAGCVDYYR